MVSDVAIIVMVLVLPLNSIFACIPTPIIDDTIIPITTTLPTRPPPCSTCPTPVQVEDNICQQLTIVPCDENNRILYNRGLICVITTQD
uniref:Secreted protein n=1 Tax=Panagrolaimus davidi TaxID=227884 RepID=A0A914PZT5_9BILA